ncbi:MAG: [FeFe] hydrogenase H-cluster radical SAM maturase HydE [Clostridia bacterium]|nr:[FeFe] hydrogenase H-cluster radical SAM maturase HydE [Clostridia bacterium]
MERALQIINKLQREHDAGRDELIHVLKIDDSKPLLVAADKTRERFVGDEVHLRGLIELTNFCRNTCLYCGLRAQNKNLKRYHMSVGDVIKTARVAADMGLKTIVLQGGEDAYYSLEDICYMITRIKEFGVAVTLSLGEFPRYAYKKMRQAGADRYLLRIETTNKRLYGKMHPGLSFENRVRCLGDLKDLGFETGTGCLVGLPGQTYDMLADDLIFFKELDADMIGLGPFIPSPDTPLAHQRPGDVDVALKMVALVRLLLPDINIPSTTALGTIAGDGYKRGLESGANVIMPNMGMGHYKKLYSLYPGKMAGSPQQHLGNAKNIIRSLDRRIGTGQGFRAVSHSCFN